MAFGRIVRFHNLEVKKKLEETDRDVLLFCLVELRRKFSSKNKTIITPFKFNELSHLKSIVPKAGDNKKILELSKKNATIYKLEKLKKIQIIDPERHVKRIMNSMKVDLKLKEFPLTIDCFDISNIQGSYTVASCVVFKNGKPYKNGYRKYNIKSVSGPDDFASMKEVVFRRYKRLIDEEKELPNLIIVDGGKGQLSSSVSALKSLKLEDIPVLGIAKRLEEIFYPNDPIPLYLDKRSETLKIIQHIRNEAHRFAITFHRNKRSIDALSSSLDSIPGIGEKTKIYLLKKYRSLKKIREIPESILANDIGNARAKKLVSFFNSSE